jgi:hypothetical protein
MGLGSRLGLDLALALIFADKGSALGSGRLKASEKAGVVIDRLGHDFDVCEADLDVHAGMCGGRRRGYAA